MSVIHRLPETDPLYAHPAPERPFYATGMLLDAGDFLAEQTYHRGRLAQAVAFVTGGGTLAGLRVTHAPAAADAAGEIRVAPGVAVDRLGRLVEIPRPACLRLDRWWHATFADDGDALTSAAYGNFAGFLSARVQAEAGAGGAPPLPARAVIADVYLRFVACERGYTPSFASGPYDALDAVAVSRLRDAYELLLVPRSGLDNDDPDDIHHGLPRRGPDLAANADVDVRRAGLQDAVLDAWPARGRAGSAETLDPLAEHATGVDPTAVFLARVLIPVAAGTPPPRDGEGVVVDNWVRRFVPSSQLVQRWLGI